MARLVIHGGTVLDGTGGPAPRRPTSSWSTAASPRSDATVDATGARVLDAGGAYVAPGFIDSTPTSTRRCSGTAAATRCPSTA